MAVVDKRRSPADELIGWLRERACFEEKCPSSHQIPDLLALAYASRDGLDDAYAIAHSPPGAPHRYSWKSERFGVVDLYAVVGCVNADGEPEVEALKWNVCPINMPGYVDEVGRRIFELEFAAPQAAHPGWDRSPLAPKA